VVTVADGRLVIRPWFPFNVFVPESAGLEHDIPVDHVLQAQVTSASGGVRLKLRAADGRLLDLTLYLRQPQVYLQALGAAERETVTGTAEVPVPAKPQGPGPWA
jgi:hypothetical protein